MQPNLLDPVSRVSLFAFDAPASGLVLVGGGWLWCRRAAVVRRVRSEALAAASVLLALVYLASIASHISLRSTLGGLRAAEVAAVAWSVARMSRRSPLLVLMPAVGMVCFQAMLATAQVLNHGKLGLYWLGEIHSPDVLGAVSSGKGTFEHRYQLAGYAAVVAFGLLAAFIRSRDKRLLVPLAL